MPESVFFRGPASLSGWLALTLPQSGFRSLMAVSSPTRSSAPNLPPGVQLPYLRVTRFDTSSSFLMATAIAIIVGVIWAFTQFWATRPPRQPDLVPMEVIPLGGGVEDGDPDDTLEIESPEDPVTESQEQEPIDELEAVVQMSDQVIEQFELKEQVAISDKTGSSQGTGKRPLGFGPGNAGGVAPELRWFIRFADGASLTEYAKQLDFFGIELGAILPDGRLAYLSGMSGAPKVRYSMSGKDEKRLYMKWEGGERRSADEKLFQKAGLQVGKAVIFHFYPNQTEQLLLNLEFNYAKRNVKEIRRTYFLVNTQGKGYEFVVSRQLYLR